MSRWSFLEPLFGLMGRYYQFQPLLALLFLTIFCTTRALTALTYLYIVNCSRSFFVMAPVTRMQKRRNERRNSRKIYMGSSCVVCLQVWSVGVVPVVLGCGHCICRECCWSIWRHHMRTLPGWQRDLTSLLARGGFAAVHCPICRVLTCIDS